MPRIAFLVSNTIKHDPCGKEPCFVSVNVSTIALRACPTSPPTVQCPTTPTGAPMAKHTVNKTEHCPKPPRSGTSYLCSHPKSLLSTFVAFVLPGHKPNFHFKSPLPDCGCLLCQAVACVLLRPGGVDSRSQPQSPCCSASFSGLLRHHRSQHGSLFFWASTLFNFLTSMAPLSSIQFDCKPWTFPYPLIIPRFLLLHRVFFPPPCAPHAQLLQYIGPLRFV